MCITQLSTVHPSAIETTKKNITENIKKNYKSYLKKIVLGFLFIAVSSPFFSSKLEHFWEIPEYSEMAEEPHRERREILPKINEKFQMFLQVFMIKGLSQKISDVFNAEVHRFSNVIKHEEKV